MSLFWDMSLNLPNWFQLSIFEHFPPKKKIFFSMNFFRRFLARSSWNFCWNFLATFYVQNFLTRFRFLWYHWFELKMMHNDITIERRSDSGLRSGTQRSKSLELNAFRGTWFFRNRGIKSTFGIKSSDDT